jgi:predicted ATPase
VLGRLLPGWPAVPQADSALVDPVVLLGEAVRELLGVIAEPSGVLLGLDDLHWADPDSLALLGYLAGRIGESPVVVIGTARDDEKTPPGLVQLRRYPSVTVLALSRLSSDEVATLARQRSDRLTQTAVETVVSAADGLPLLVEELVDAGVGT